MDELKKYVEESKRILNLIISANILFEHKEVLLVEDLTKLLVLGGLIHNELDQLEKLSTNLNVDFVAADPFNIFYVLKLFEEVEDLKNKRNNQYDILMKNLAELPNLIAV